MKKNEFGITEWRTESPIEGWLASKADDDEFWREAYVRFYRELDEDYYSTGLNMIEKCFRTFEHDFVNEGNRDLVVKDMIYSLHRFGFSFEEFFWYELWGKNASERREFVPDKVRYELYDALNSHDAFNLFSNKWASYNRFKEYFGREAIIVRSEEDLDVLRSFQERHGSFIVKPLHGCCGKGTFIMDSSDLNEAFSLIESGGMIAEELIDQDCRMASCNPSSVNTVRVPTLISNGEVHILTPCFRMGREGQCVDNGGSGGVMATVNKVTGVCLTHGVDEFGREFVNHPDSGLAIKGFEIPLWDDVIKMVNELSGIVQDARYIGWDLALSSKGWVLVEGNSKGQFLSQIVERKGVMKELLDLVYEDKSKMPPKYRDWWMELTVSK